MRFLFHLDPDILSAELSNYSRCPNTQLTNFSKCGLRYPLDKIIINPIQRITCSVSLSALDALSAGCPTGIGIVGTIHSQVRPVFNLLGMDFSQSSYPGNQRFNRSVSQLYVQHELSSRTPFHKAFRIYNLGLALPEIFTSLPSGLHPTGARLEKEM